MNSVDRDVMPVQCEVRKTVQSICHRPDGMDFTMSTGAITLVVGVGALAAAALQPSKKLYQVLF